MVEEAREMYVNSESLQENVLQDTHTHTHTHVKRKTYVQENVFLDVNSEYLQENVSSTRKAQCLRVMSPIYPALLCVVVGLF
jgi:hypothetical protein